MRININVAMDYQLFGHESVLLKIEAGALAGQVVEKSTLAVDNATLRRAGGAGADHCGVWADVSGEKLNIRYQARVVVSRASVDLASLSAMPGDGLPDKVAVYLQPSQFCQSDLFISLVAELFGHLHGGAIICSILDWVAREIIYLPGSSNAGTTAVDTFGARAGVCRDFAHLVCSMARAANIPARYASVYGVNVSPQDFHAVAQVWLAGAWHLVDATGMSTPNTLVVIAAGRDAGDVAFMQTEHWAQPISQIIRVTQG